MASQNLRARPVLLIAEGGQLIAYIKSTPPAPGMAEILYPGERAARTRRDRLRHGIDVDPETWHRLQDLARARGIQVPDSV